MDSQHLLDIELANSTPKKTMLIATLFVFTAIIGIGGGIQQFLLTLTDTQLTLDLRSSSSKQIVFALAIHAVPFTVGVIAVFFAAKSILYRKISTLFGDTTKITHKISISFLLYTSLFLILFSLKFWGSNSLMLSSIDFNLIISSLLLILFIFVQVLFEELLFRALLPQMLVGFGLSRILAIILASIIFALLHLSNPEVTHYGLAFLVLYFLHGLFLSILYYFENGIWLALAFHFINNFLGVFIITNEEQVFKFPSLFHSYEPIHYSLLEIILNSSVTMVVFFGLSFFIFNWKNKLRLYR